MEIFSLCPFAVATLAWEPADGQKTLSVCVKATFLLTPGISTIAPVQDPVGSEGGAGDAPDLVPYKPRADILFAGHAYAPGGGVTDSLLARARIGGFRKALSINGDRTWVPSFDGLRPSAAVPFRRMPLVYERAVRTGENLTGVDISRGAAPNVPLANIAAIADQGGETPGLAPIPFGWRTHRLGITDQGILWAVRAGLALGPPPPRFDFRIFNAAPFEQQVDEIPPGCEVLLENLHPQHPQLETRLPRLRVKIFQRGPEDEGSTEVAARCDTLWIDADRGLAIALWRGLARDAGRIVVVAEAEGEVIRPSDVDRMLGRLIPSVTYVAPAFLGADPIAEPAIPDPVPLPRLDEGPDTRRASTTLIPPSPDDLAPPEALPFRTGHLVGGDPAAFDLEGAHSVAPASVDEDLTPPRGYPTVPAPTLAAPAPSRPETVPPIEGASNEVSTDGGATPALFDDVTYAGARMEAWQRGVDPREILARRGVDVGLFVAHESALADALAAEALEGGSERAIAVLRALAAARTT